MVVVEYDLLETDQSKHHKMNYSFYFECFNCCSHHPNSVNRYCNFFLSLLYNISALLWTRKTILLTYINVLQGRFINKNTHYKSKNYRSESVFIYSHKHAQMKKRFGVLEGVPFLCQRQTKNKQCFTQFFLGLFGKIQNEIFIFSSQIQNLRKTNYIPSRKIFLYWYPLPPMVERLRAI